MKNLLILLMLSLGLMTVTGLQSCESGEKQEVQKRKKKKGKKERKNKDHIDVDMVKRVTNFVKRNIEITEKQETQIKEIVETYSFDSLSREEFYFKRLEMRDRIFDEVLNEMQKQQIKNRK